MSSPTSRSDAAQPARGTAAELLCRTLENHGVTCVFGMEDPILIFHSLDRAGVRIVTIRDEKHGAIMAHGHAQARGMPGVCAATFGPGCSNLITGLLEAQKSSVPVIALVQDHPLRIRNRNPNSGLDHAAALGPFVKAVLRLDLPEQAGDVVRHAFRLACSGRPGPIAILCPTDVLAMATEADTSADTIYMHYPAIRTRPADTSISDAVDLLTSARRPVIVAGGGAIMSGAFDEIRALAEHYDAPVATTLNGRGAIGDDHPLSIGPIGNQSGGRLGRGRIANTVIREADVVCILGSRTNQLCYADWTLLPSDARVIHVDIDAVEIGRNYRVSVPLLGDVRETLRAMLGVATQRGARRGPSNGAQIAALHADWRDVNRDLAASAAQPIRPERVVAEMARVIDRSTLIVADASYSTAWAFSHFDIVAAQRTILSPRGTGSIGWGLPAAIGAKLAAPDRTVICLTGDGGFGYVMNELETAARHRVPVLIVLLNNSTLGYQRHWEQKALGSYLDCDFLDVDYAAIARAMHCEAERITDPADLAAALRRGLKSPKPYLLDIVVDPEAVGPVVGMEREIAMSESH